MRVTDSDLYQSVPRTEDLWPGQLPSDEKIPRHTFSRRFEREMKRLIREQRHTPGTGRLILTTKRIATAMPISTTLSFSILMSVDAY